MGLALRLLDELRPRFVYLRLKTPGFKLRWAIPHPVVEEIAALALKLGPTLLWLARRRRRGRATHIWPLLPALTIAMLAHDGRGILRIPSGDVFVSVKTDEVDIEIGQL